jgi:hypothetical protein
MKFEIRNSKFETNSKPEVRNRRQIGNPMNLKTSSPFTIDSNFDLRICFEFRISNFEFPRGSFGFCRDWLIAGTEGRAFGIEGIEFAEDGIEGALAGDFLAVEHAAVLSLLAEIGLNGCVVAIDDADELRGEAVTKQFEFVQLGFESLSLARSVPLANDGLQRDIGVERQFVGAGADLDGGTKGIFELLPAFVDGPGLGNFALGEVDKLKGPPFFDFEGAVKGEGVEESELPIVALGKFFEHGAHGTLAVIEFEEFANEDLGATSIDFKRLTFEEFVGGPAQIFEGEHGMRAQKIAGGLERVLHEAVGAGEQDHEAVEVFARGRQNDFHFARGEKLFGEAFDEPGRKFSRATGGIAIGEFEQESLSEGANVFASIDEVGELKEIFPAVAEAFGVERDGSVRPGREVKSQMNAAAPGSGVGEFVIEELFDALGGDGEQHGVQENEGRVGAEMACGIRESSAAAIVDVELAADAANGGGGLGVSGMNDEQQETEGTEEGNA